MKYFYLAFALVCITAVAGTGRILDSAISDNAGIKYSKMQTIPTHTFIGNKTSGSSVASSMTGAEATALLSTMVGDTGTGGVAGLCPAPVAGDSTKFLGGDGAYHTVTSGVTSVNSLVGAVTLTTDNISEGSTNLYFTASRALNQALTGLSTASSTVVTATDSILVGIGNLQAQISALGTAATHAATDFVQTAVSSTISVTGAASTPALKFTGSPYSLGTATTNKPLLWMEDGAPVSTNWSTKGTYFGVNAASTFTGRLMDLQINGGTVFSVDYGNSLNAQQPGVFFRNIQDNSNAFNICGKTGLPGTSANCSSLYQGNGGSFVWYSLDASGGAFAIWSAQMAWATMTIGNSAFEQSFSSTTQPELLVVNQNWASANTSPTIGLMPKTSQTAPLLQTYQPYSTLTAPFSVTAAGFPAITPQGAGVAPTSPVDGQFALTSGHKLCVYTGSAWVNASDGSTTCTF